jgi:peptide/nickel transport system substrate-binding protein
MFIMKVMKKTMITVHIVMIFIASTIVFADMKGTKDIPDLMEFGETYYPSKPVRGGVLRVASPVYIGLMNPNHFPVLDWVTISSFYEKLINNDGQFKPTVPWLAESWKYLDKVTVLMQLRQGIRYHDQTVFNAESLKYQMDWIMDKENNAWTRTWMEPLESVEIIDDYTVKWHFKRPWGAFLGTIASVPGFMISAKALKADAALSKLKILSRTLIAAKRKAGKLSRQAHKNTDKKAKAEKAARHVDELESRINILTQLAHQAKPLDTHPVGTGQYMLEQSSPGNYIKLIRNPDWWFGKTVGRPDMPYFDGIKISIIPDASVRLANLRAEKLDIANLNAIQYRLVKHGSQLNKQVVPLNWLIFLMFNQSTGPCKDFRIRKAISHAIDRKALVLGTQHGLGRIASCIFPDNHWAHNPDLKPVSYDPSLSKKLLAQAGYGKVLTLRGFIYNSPEALAFTKAIMAMLDKVGIKWQVDFLDIAAMLEPFSRLDYDLAGGLYQWILEPDQIASTLYHPDGVLNYGRSINKEAIALILKGREEIDDSKRTLIYHQLEKVLQKNYEDVWLWWPNAVIASSKKLEGLNEDMAAHYGEAYTFSHPGWFRIFGSDQK